MNVNWGEHHHLKKVSGGFLKDVYIGAIHNILFFNFIDKRLNKTSEISNGEATKLSVTHM